MGVFDVVNFIRAQVVNFWLAPKLPAVLDMENSAGKAGPTGGPGGRPILDSYDEPRQP
jgi:hypothetical protein